MAEKLKLEVSDEIAIKVESMNKWFGSFHVLRDIDLTVNRTEESALSFAAHQVLGNQPLFAALTRLRNIRLVKSLLMELN